MSTDLVKVFPLTPTLATKLQNLTDEPPTLTADQAVDVLAEYLSDVDAKAVKVHKGRVRYETIREYLEEMPCEVIVRVAEIAVRCASGERWGNIFGGKAFQFFQWMGLSYPVTRHLMDACERLRGEARAQKALDTLDEVAESAEQDGARVKACELTLRAHHAAFGAKTAQKEGSTRPIIVVNLANIFGADGGKVVENGEVV